MKKSRLRYYVGMGIKSGKYEVFGSHREPTKASHGSIYKYCFGAYDTRSEAEEIKAYQS